MDWTVCSRETERDYTWDNTQASHPVAQYAQGHFAPGFEGSLTTSRFAALLRCPGSPRGVMLCASASTARKDFVGRPIRTMAFLRAETLEESHLLAAFFAECLRKPDKETLYDAASPQAQAVESLYQTKNPDGFIAFCKGIPPIKRWNPPAPKKARNTESSTGIRVGGVVCPQESKSSEPEPTDSEVPFTERSERPRNEMAARERTAEKLGSIIGSETPFLVALTDRVAEDVMKSLGPEWARTPVRIFSKHAASLQTIPFGAGLEPGTWSEPVSQKYAKAATIGGIVVLSILFVAAIGPCSRGCGKGEVARTASTVIRTSGGGSRLGNGETNDSQNRNSAPTNAPTGGTIDATNAPQSRLEIGGSVSNVTIPSVRTETEK